jgi:glycyl-tRNA synthetase beta subunit
MGLLEGETAILRKIASLQDAVRAAVMNRDWTDFETLLASLQEYCDQFETLEAERVRFFSVSQKTSSGNDEKTGFYTITARFPEAERSALSAAYRTLKLETLRMRLTNNSLLEYLNEAKNAVDSFFEAVFPDRKGRLYSRHGVRKPADMRSMVLNHSF